MKKLLILMALLFGSILLSISAHGQGLIAHYPFDGNFQDASGNGHNASMSGNVSFVPDRFGNSGASNNF